MRLITLAALGLSALASALTVSPQSAGQADADNKERPSWGVKYFQNCPGPYNLENNSNECTLLRNKLTTNPVVLESNWEFRTAFHTNEASEIQIDLYPYDESFGNQITGGVEICVWRAYKDVTLTAANQPERMAFETQKAIYEYAEEDFSKCLAVIPVPKGHVRSIGKPSNTYVIPLPALEHNADNAFWNVYIHSASKNTAKFMINAYSAEYSPIVYGDHKSITNAMTTMRVPQAKNVNYEDIEIDVMYDGEYVSSTGYNYYKLKVPIPIPDRMDIYMSPVFGDPDIFVTLDGSDPSIDNSAYDSAMQVGTEVVIIRSTDTGPGQVSENCANDGILEFCEIRIAVYGFTNSIYSIIVVQDGSLIPLTRNHPFVDYTVGGEESANFYMYVPDKEWWEHKTRFTFVVTPFAGDPDIFVSSSKADHPLPTNIEDACWYSTSTRVEVVDIFPPDEDDKEEDINPCYCSGKDCVYYIGVVGYGPTTYSIVAEESYEDSDSFVELIDGVTQSGFVAEGRNQYYRYVFPPAEADHEKEDRRVFLSVVPGTGDPDIYVALGGKIPTHEGNYDYRSSSTGPEQITMKTSDAAWKDSDCADPKKPCEIIIAVHGYTTSHYEISITGADSTVISEGQSLPGTATDAKMTYFRFQSVKPKIGITVSVVPVRGNPELFIGNDAHKNTFPVGKEDGKYLWKSVGEGLELIYIDAEDENRCNSPCWYSIGVLAEQGFAQFVISVIVDDGAPFVNPGEPLYASVRQGEHKRYQAVIDRSLGYLEVVVSPMFGNPDLYMALENKNVSKDDHQWASYSINADEDILVTPDDPRFIAKCPVEEGVPPEKQKVCVANIAVYGESNALYILTVSDGLRHLLDGIATVGRVPPKSYSYFKFTMHAREPFTVSVTPTSGNPDMFISPSVKPTKEKHVWEAVSVGPEVITVTPDDPEFADCELPCHFYIGIYGTRESQQSSFRIIATSHDSTTILSDGVSVVAYTRAKVMSYFSFYVPTIPDGIGSNVAIEFTVTPLGSVSSEVSFYVGNIIDEEDGVVQYPHVLCQDEDCDTFIVENAHWDSTKSATRREISIRGNDPNLKPGTYVLGVYSNYGASVSVMASTGSTNKVLYPGIPLQDSTSEGQYTYYTFPLTSADKGSDVIVLATPISGDPDMYVSFHRANPRPGAGPDKSADKSSISSFGVERIVIEWEENEECHAALEAVDGSCAVYIGILGYTSASYSIVAHLATEDDDPDLIGIMLEDGIPLADQVVMNRQKFYYVNVDVPNGHPYLIYVRAMYGDPDVYVTTSGKRPGVEEGEYDYASIHAESDDIINIVPGTPGYKNKAIVWTLVTGFSSTAYLITFSSSDTVTMVADGRSVGASATAGSYNYYSFHVEDPKSTIKFAVTAYSGDPDIYASVWGDRSPNFRPKKEPGQHTWEGTVLGSNILVIDADDPESCTSACTYIIGIYCASLDTCRYHFTATASGETHKPISLVNGEPMTYSISSPNGIVYFGFNYGGGLKDTTFTLQGDTANLEMYITNEYNPEERPPGKLPDPDDPASYYWADFGGTGSIFVSREDEYFDVFKPYYTIAVVTPSHAEEGEITFTITATNSNTLITLLPGVTSPFSALPKAANEKYRFQLENLNQDFSLLATPLYGSLVLAITTRTSDISCASATSCPNAIWTNIGTKDNKIIINAPKKVTLSELLANTEFAPCVGPYVTGTCTEADWKTGYMYIAVYAAEEVGFTLTAYISDNYINLEDGKPQFAYTSETTKPMFRYRNSIRDLSFPDYRISFNVYDNEDRSPIAYYIAGCEASKCTSEHANPGPGFSQEYGIIPVEKSADVFLTRFSDAYCTPPIGGSCNIFISVWPTGKGCEDKDKKKVACSTVFGVTFQTQTNNARTVINFNSIDQQILPLIGNVSPSKTSLFAVYLDPKKSVDMNVDLEACGPGYPVIYACNAQPAEGVEPCKLPSVPGPKSGNGYTSAAKTAPSGIATITDFDVKSPAFYLSVAGTNDIGMNNAVNDDETWSYILHVSAGETLYLYTPTDNSISSDVDGTSIKLSWKTAEIFDHLDEFVGLAEKISYEVYAAESGFNGSHMPNAIVPTTSCGLIRWSLLANVDPIVVPGLDKLSHVVTGLKAHTNYEFNVIASCDEDCWDEQKVKIVALLDDLDAAIDTYESVVLGGYYNAPLTSLKAFAQKSGLGKRLREHIDAFEDISDVATLRAIIAEKRNDTLKQRHSVQRVAYKVAQTKTGAGVDPKKTKGFPKAGVIGILLIVAILVGGFFLYRRYRRGRDSQRTTQYSYLDLEDSLPSSGGSAGLSVPTYSSQGGYEPPSMSSSGGLIGSLQSALRLPSGRTNNKVPLAEEDYSSLHNQVEGYL